MKKQIVNTVIIMLLAVSTAFGQIVLTNEDQGVSPRASSSNPEFGVMVPIQNTNLDQYTENYMPLGEGWLLLAFLGAAWGTGKKLRDKR